MKKRSKIIFQKVSFYFNAFLFAKNFFFYLNLLYCLYRYQLVILNIAILNNLSVVFYNLLKVTVSDLYFFIYDCHHQNKSQAAIRPFFQKAVPKIPMLLFQRLLSEGWIVVHQSKECFFLPKRKLEFQSMLGEIDCFYFAWRYYVKSTKYQKICL